jgi:hypothetical protein
VSVRFPTDRPARAEPLVVLGDGATAEYVYVVYGADARQVRLGYARTGVEPIVSSPIPVDFRELHRIGIRTGALLPSENHWYFDAWTDSDLGKARREVEVTLDGIPLIRTAFENAPSSSARITVGRNDISSFTDKVFSGQIAGLRRGPLEPPLGEFRGDGFVRLALRLPANATGRAEPLIATGSAGASDLLFISYESASTVRLGLRHDGNDPLLSAPLVIKAGELQLLEVSLGSFYPSGSKSSADLAVAAIVRWNGELVWAEERPFHAAGAGRPSIGKNPAAVTGVLTTFSGELVAVQPVAFPERPAPAPGAAAAREGYGALRLTVQFPRGLEAVFEPLVVAGTAVDRADYLWLRYLDASSILIGYEHTGGGGPNSGPIALDFSRSHVIEIELPSLFPPEGDVYFAGWPRLRALQVKNRVRVVLDGVVRIDAPAKAYEAPPAAVGVGENRISDTFGRKFTGTLTRQERITAPAPSGR